MPVPIHLHCREYLDNPLISTFSEVCLIESRLDAQTVRLSNGFDAVCLFVNDDASEHIMEELASNGVKAIAMRCAGYDRVDLKAAKRHGIKVVRVPTYSPRTVAEMALAMVMASSRCLLSAIRKVAVGNYSLNGLVGYETTGKTFGIVGTGNIGVELIKLLKGFNARILAYVFPFFHILCSVLVLTIDIKCEVLSCTFGFRLVSYVAGTM